MLKRTIFLFFILFIFIIRLHSFDLFSPAQFDTSGQYPLLLIRSGLFTRQDVKKYCDEQKFFACLADTIKAAGDIEDLASRKGIDKHRIYWVGSGLDGLKILYYNPYSFASGVILLGRKDIEEVIRCLRSDPVAMHNIGLYDSVIFIPERGADKKSLDLLEDLISEKGFPISIRNKDAAQADDILDLCRGEMDDEAEKVDLKTDSLDFNYARWLEIIKRSGSYSRIRAEISGNGLLVRPYHVDGFSIDLSSPEFGDWQEEGEPFSIIINDKTCYLGEGPFSKKLYVLYGIITTTNLAEAQKMMLEEKSKEEVPASPELSVEETKEIPDQPVSGTEEAMRSETGAALPEAGNVKQSDIKSWTEPDKFIPGKEKVVLKFGNIKDDINKWDVDISLMDGRSFRTFSGEKDFKPALEWDGKSASGEVLPNGADCSYQLKYEDTAGDKYETPRFRLDTKLAVEQQKKTLLIRFTDILFKKNISALDPEAKKILNKVTDVLKQNRDNIERISIDGHTDNIGPKEYNQKLSEKRSQSVLSFLANTKIIRSDLYAAAGYGDNKPLFPNDNDENRKKNRRVEIMIKLR
ncbi:MAG: OmpA family protein [bacterium]|nr:OmpA family protein [bacterium]